MTKKIIVIAFFILCVLMWILVVDIIQEIKQEGLKVIVEEIWEGKVK